MLKKILTCLLAFVGVTLLYAGGLPTASTEGNEVWYLIKFSEGGFVFDGKTENAGLRNESATGSEAQLWKFVGDDAQGYKITNKLGLSIYVTQADKKNGTVKVAKTPTTGNFFKIVQTTNAGHKGDFEIIPVGNETIGLNLAGGVQWRNGNVGMWDKKDPNNCLTFVSESDFKAMASVAIIPYPKDLKFWKEGMLDLTTLSNKTIKCPVAAMNEHLTKFVQELAAASGIQFSVVENGEAAIDMTVNSQLAAEAYTLKVNENGIAIQAKDQAGFFYALQTLKQLLPRAYFDHKQIAGTAWKVPFVDINDQPALGHRGFMLDVARHFFTKEEVMRILDVMALYKMNIFHWHLTEDQGWRIEIPEYPRLTEVGSIRKASNSSSGFLDDTEYGRGMWYTQNDLKEVVAYAQARNINIIPEVDFPGHMKAAVTAYPELSCDPTKTHELRVWGGISKDVLNIGDDKVIDFLKTIMDNLAEIFPYQYIHFGGDECPTDQWAENAQCLKRVRDNKLGGVHELQSWLIEELGTYVKTMYNKDIMVWDELTAHWNKNNKIKPVVMCWHNNNEKAEKLGLHTITCPHDYTYLDMMQIDKNKALIDEPYRGGWSDDKVTTVEKTYSLNPHYRTSNNLQNVWGVQANMWTETTNDNEELEYQVFPRLIATAEVGWLPVSKKDWASFRQRLQSHDEILDFMGVTYAKHYIDPVAKSDQQTAVDEAEKIISESVKGGVGYPAAETYDALVAALNTAKVAGATADQVAALKNAIKAYKEAPIVQPVAGKVYQILSASTNYKMQYAGSSLYLNGNGLRIHYTPQTEPEELWEFVVNGGNTYLQNLASGKQVTLGNQNTAVGLNAAGTAVQVVKATGANGGYTYIPGVVTIGANGKWLVAQNSGSVNVGNDVKLCNPGTWKLVEVTDYKAQLQGLCNKCEATLRSAQPDVYGYRPAHAYDYLRNEVMAPAQAALAGEVTKDVYMQYAALYDKFLAIPVIERGKATTLEAAATSGKAYTLSTLRDNVVVLPNSNAMNTLSKADFVEDFQNASQQFAFVKRGANYYLYSVRAHKFVKKDNTLCEAKGDAVTFKAGNPYISVGNGNPTKNDREGAQRIVLGGDRAINVDGSKALQLISWGTGDNQTDDGNSFYVVEAADFDFAPFRTSELEADGSFGKNMHWYKLSLPYSGKSDCVIQAAQAGKVDSKEAYNAVTADGQFFAFVKQDGGYLIYNYAAGAGKVLWSEKPAVGDNAPQRLSMMDKDAAVAQTWNFVENANKDAQYFGYALVRSDVENGYISRKGDELGYWVATGAATDPHSCFRFMEVSAAEIEKAAVQLQSVLPGAVGSSSYFSIPENSQAFSAAYEALMQDLNNNNCAIALSNQVSAAMAVDTVAFDANKYYRIQNVMRGGNLEATASNGLIQQAANSANVNALWTVAFDANGKVSVKHANTGKYISNFTAVGNQPGDFKFKTIARGEYGLHKMVGDKDQYLVQYAGGDLGSWYTPSAGGDHGWYFVPVESIDIAMTASGEKTYASVFLPFAVELPAEVKAYTGTLNVEKTSLKMTAQGNQLPKETGLVLEGAQNVVKAVLKILSNEVSALTVHNDITGTKVVKAVATNDPTYWVLGNHDTDGIGFYHLNATKLAPNKAFLHVEAPAVNGFRLDFGEVTGIENVEGMSESVPAIYDLAGRKVAKMNKGLYIVNGKKVYVK